MELSQPSPKEEPKDEQIPNPESDFFKKRKLASVQKITSLSPLDQKNLFQIILMRKYPSSVQRFFAPVLPFR